MASTEFVVFREALGRQTASLGAIAEPILQVGGGDRPCPAGRILPGQAFAQSEDLDVGQAAVLVALQAHALAARHFRRLIQGEDQQLAVFADDRDVIAGGRRDSRDLGGRIGQNKSVFGMVHYFEL